VGADNCKPAGDPVNLCERYAQAQCRYLYQCCNAHERQDQDSNANHSTEAECVEELAKGICQYFLAFQDSIDGERMEWKSDEADACFKKQEDAIKQCDTEALYGQNQDNDECAFENLSVGKVKTGDDCFHQGECEDPDDFCAPKEQSDPDTVTITAKGECKSSGGEGDPCDSTGDCKSGHFCDYNDQLCHALKANGDPCDYNNESCQSGHCDENNLLCAAKLPNGDPCYQDSMCESDFCDFATSLCGDEGGTDEPDVIYDICDGEP
jgi:hypothetical protein